MTVRTPIFPPQGSNNDVEAGGVFTPKFDADGLIPAIVADADDGAVLMFAWMNAEALSLTLSSGTAHFWSRSRRKLWLKGEESGNTLEVEEVRVDCDQDVILVRARVTGAGVACHTGARSCFYRAVAHAASPDGTFKLTSSSGSIDPIHSEAN
jgi:phosphoribosyl-AMP cyclohydrolase